MINYLLLSVVVLGCTIQNVLKKQFDIKNPDAKLNYLYQYTFFTLLSACVFLGVIYIFNFSFCLETLLYASIFAVTFYLSIFGTYQALAFGPLSLTVLISSFSTTLPLLYGATFLKETLSVFGIIGLVVLGLSLVLVNKVDKGEKINKKWLIYIVIAFVANGFNSIIQKAHQLNVGGNYTICFQFIAMAITVVIAGVVMLVKEKPNPIGFVKNGGVVCSSIAGVTNAIVNVLMLYLAVKMKAVILYSVVSAGGVVLSFLTALIIYKEKLNKLQYIGSLLGLISIILLNL